MCTLLSFLNKWQLLPFSSFVLILQEFCRIILDAFRVLPVIPCLWIGACLECPIPANKRGACAQEVPSDALERGWEGLGLADLAKRESSWNFLLLYYHLILLKLNRLLVFSSGSSPSLWWGEGRGFWHPEKKKALRTTELIKDKYCFVRFVLQQIFNLFLAVWVKSLVGSSWALKFHCIFYPSGIFSSGFALSPLCCR